MVCESYGGEAGLIDNRNTLEDEESYVQLDVKDNEGNIVGISFVRSGKISLLESLTMVHEGSHQDQKVEGSVSLQEDLELSSSDSDEDLQQIFSGASTKEPFSA